MKPIRIIPRIDVKGPNVVKGIHLEGLRVLGEPQEFAKCYFEDGADEIFYQDVVASLYGQNTLEDIIKQTAKNIFIPLTVGGGIRSIEDIRHILRCGADKVAINTQAVKDPSFIRASSKEFGSSTIVVVIEASRVDKNKYNIFTDNGREKTDIDAIEWSKKIQELGAGEIVVTSIDREGTGKGYDLDLCNDIKKHVNIPVIIHGGAGNINHVVSASQNTNTFDGISMASMLHYTLIEKNNFKLQKNNFGNKEYISRSSANIKFEKCDIKKLKLSLKSKDINIRL